MIYFLKVRYPSEKYWTFLWGVSWRLNQVDNCLLCPVWWLNNVIWYCIWLELQFDQRTTQNCPFGSLLGKALSIAKSALWATNISIGMEWYNNLRGALHASFSMLHIGWVLHWLQFAHFFRKIKQNQLTYYGIFDLKEKSNWRVEEICEFRFTYWNIFLFSPTILHAPYKQQWR